MSLTTGIRLHSKIGILFVQNLPNRGITAIDAFRPDAAVSQMHVVRELEAVPYLREIGASEHWPEPGLIVLDVEMSDLIQEAIRRELRDSGRTAIPLVQLEKTGN